MGLVVQKFGGTSVRTPKRIKAAAEKVLIQCEKGNNIVAVVSALGHTTDRLIRIAQAISTKPHERELDMLLSTGEQQASALLAIALQSQGQPAVSLIALQAGISTDGLHNRARILGVRTELVHQHLRDGKVVVLAGYQGIDAQGNITTLGRGGSDVTAVAIAAALMADLCEIYTDVDGVYTADPQICLNAKKIAFISYDEMLVLAGLGAGVIHPRAVALARKYHVLVHVRSSFTNTEGTLIMKESDVIETAEIRGVALERNVARIDIKGLPDKVDNLAKIFSIIADANLQIDLIIKSSPYEGKTDLSFTITENDCDEINIILQKPKNKLAFSAIDIATDLAKVSMVGSAIRQHPEVMAKAFKALAEAEIPIIMVGISEIKISCLVPGELGEKAVWAVHEAFKLGVVHEE